MKKLFLLLFAAFSLLAFNACQDDNVTAEELIPNDTAPDYLLMHYSVGSGNLDPYILSNILHALDQGSDDKVKMTFQYKLSGYYQNRYEGMEEIDFTGTRRFTADDNKHLVGKYDDLASSHSQLIQTEIDSLCCKINSDSVGDRFYNMSCADGLGDFIKWSKEQYPDAKHTILVIAGHGYGWQFEYDGVADGNLGQTRSILHRDNNLAEPDLLSLNETVEGLKQGGGVDLFYTDACLMSTYENIYGYASCAKYLLASLAEISAFGGNYSQFLKLLKDTGNTDLGFEEAMHQYVDACTSKEWWGQQNLIYGNLGFYNLTKLDQVTLVLKKLTDTLIEKFKSDESIEPTAEELPYGETFAPYIRNAVLSCEMAWRYDEVSIFQFDSLISPFEIYDAINEDKDYFTSGYYYLSELIAWLRYCDTPGAKKMFDKDPQRCQKFLAVMSSFLEKSFVITDMIRLLDKNLDAVGAKNNPFKEIRQELSEAIKSMAYIKCVMKEDIAGIDPEYDQCTPGVTIIPFNEELFNSDLNYKLIENNLSVNDALRIYQNLEFDKQVGWSRFLQTIDVFPSAMTNSSRSNVK